MKNLKVSRKLITGFLIVTAFTIIIACVGIYSATSINDNYTYLIRSPIKRQVHLQHMEYDFAMMRYRLANFVMNSGDTEFINGKLLPQFQSAYDSYMENYSAFMKSNMDDQYKSKSVIEATNEKAVLLGDMMTKYQQVAKQVLAKSLEGDMETADDILKSAISLSGDINTATENLITPAAQLVTDIEGNNEKYSVNIMIIQICITIICSTTAIILAVYISRLISRPITALTKLMDRAGTKGDLTLTQEDDDNIRVFSQAKDEIGKCISTSAEFFRHMLEMNDNLAKVADGDLTVDINLLSDEDTMGKAVKQMVRNLNGMFAEIQTSASEVLLGSKQVSDGSQALAQGSTEQAASIAQLSDAISEIAIKTRTNAQTADRTAKLSSDIRENAETGNRQMREMIAAVNDINTSSQSISNIIKTIDDIAFQTNILALNAAVEAARAGQHGKGFAVVAEEVRNLASKSAEAAKNTGDMIQDSMNKAKFGSRIAGETASSLTKIVDGINESSQLVAEIAKSSEEQSVNISQINIGIDQVTRVVQQNTVTAEQSAASSQQMNSQSDMLQQLITQFKLKDAASLSLTATSY